MRELGLRVRAEYQQSVVQVRGGVSQEGAVGDGAGRSGSKAAGLQRQIRNLCPILIRSGYPLVLQSEE